MAARMALLLWPFEPTAQTADLEHQAWAKHRPLCPPCPTHDTHGPCVTPPSLDGGTQAGKSGTPPHGASNVQAAFT